MKNTLMMGCVADDYTGASDAASFLIGAGLKTLLFNGIPNEEISPCHAVVIALKSRTQEKAAAVQDSLAAFAWLHKQGARHLYFKYCSTFDSTKEGNIGPVLDAVLQNYKAPYSILCPALPVNGRLVKEGVLYVDGVPLSETHMKNHPLTPMWASEIAKLMEPQSQYETLNLPANTLEKGDADIQALLSAFATGKEHFYIVPDYETDAHGEKIAALFGDCTVLSGGSGILAHLAKRYRRQLEQEAGTTNAACFKTKTKGRGLVLSGSCSKATLAQIADFEAKGYPSYALSLADLLSGKETLDSICRFIEKHGEQAVLVHSMGDTKPLADETQKQKVAALLENTAAELAKKAVDSGYTRLVVAGGETSSAAIQKLGYAGFEIGESVAPGVPVMMPLANRDIRLVLKSGNFGQVDFFERALNMTYCDEKDS